MFEGFHLPEPSNYDEYIRETMMKLAKANEYVRNNSMAAPKGTAQELEKKLGNVIPYKDGDPVMTFVVARKNGSIKIERKFDGSFKVVTMHNEGMFHKFDNGLKVHHERL